MKVDQMNLDPKIFCAIDGDTLLDEDDIERAKKLHSCKFERFSAVNSYAYCFYPDQMGGPGSSYCRSPHQSPACPLGKSAINGWSHRLLYSKGKFVYQSILTQYLGMVTSRGSLERYAGLEMNAEVL